MKRANLAILSIVMCMFVLSISQFKVEPAISIVNADKLASFLTIQEAINAANSGETVYVRNGTYYEHVVMNKSVMLVGESCINTIIDGTGSGVVVQVTANDAGVSGFTIQNGNFGVSIVNSDCENISGNMMKNNFQGICFQNSHNNLVNGNNLTNNNQGIIVQQSNNSLILANSLEDNYSPGISLYCSHNNTVSRNFVRNNPAYGIYLENCQNNTLSENSVTLVCDGISLQNSQNNTISGNTVTKTGPFGIDLEYSNENVVEKNILEENEIAFQLFRSFNNLVTENSLAMNKFGLFLDMSSNNTLEKNHMTANWASFGVFGEQPLHFVNSISVSNTVDGRPVYYWIDRHGDEVPSDAGYVALVNSTNIRVTNLKLANNYEGILLAYSNHIILRNLTVSNNFIGAWLFNSCSNIVTECTLRDNTESVWLKQSNNNTIYWNNFVDQNLPDVSGTSNEWDNGYPNGGNYWATFAGTDRLNGPYQNTTGNDGISDVGYALNAGNKDRFPLMSPIKVFDAGEWGGLRYCVYAISNYTVSDFSFDPSERVVSFNVSGPEGANGFCRVVIPIQLLWAEDEQWRILFEGREMNYTRTSSQGYTCLYFTLIAGSGTVKVLGTEAISEFQTFTVVVLFLIFASTLAAIVAKKGFRAIVLGQG